MKTKKKPKRKRDSGPFSSNLKQMLAEREISIRGAATICDVQPSTVHDWINGAQCNKPQALVKLCKALNCDFQWLLTGTKNEINPKDLAISEMFDVEDQPDFTGVFLISAKRLKRREIKE